MRHAKASGIYIALRWCGPSRFNPFIWVESIHYGPGQMVGPPGCVVVGPESRVNLRNNNLHIFWSNIVDLFAQRRGGIDTMGAHLNLPSAVAVQICRGRYDFDLQLGRKAP